MIEALLEPEQNKDANALAELARGKLRAKLPELRKALQGRFREHHGFLVTEILAHVDYMDEALDRMTVRIEEAIRPFAGEVDRLRTIPGVDHKTAQMLVSDRRSASI